MERGICLVTGASTGVGCGIALELARSGFTVYITGRSIESLKRVKESDGHGKIHPVQCDHGKDEEVDQLFLKIEDECSGRIDLLVNNAYSGAEFIVENSDKPFWDLSPDAWDTFNHVGLRNHYRCAVLASRMMVKRRKGLIINISSIGGLAYMMTPPYAIGKCALDRMALDCSLDLRGYNVAFISLWPGPVTTEKFIELVNSGDSELGRSKEAKYFLANGESPSFVGKAVRYLLEDSNIMSKTGRVLFTADVAKEYKFTDNGRRPVDFRCVRDMLGASGFGIMSNLVISWIKFPLWMLRVMLNNLAPPKKASIYQL